ncbi:hypothetical protein CDAR_74301 [Caerostris darwini]|uniref:Uncharacterized protein n=1 Tax=Caerostris darwini TaxID=1538125 RepID=A0AAV4UKM4_9ARAC|nr:hypothetical protein CDAR_74301 [Caerostris darwini]
MNSLTLLPLYSQEPMADVFSPVNFDRCVPFSFLFLVLLQIICFQSLPVLGRHSDDDETEYLGDEGVEKSPNQFTESEYVDDSEADLPEAEDRTTKKISYLPTIIYYDSETKPILFIREPDDENTESTVDSISDYEPSFENTDISDTDSRTKSPKKREDLEHSNNEYVDFNANIGFNDGFGSSQDDSSTYPVYSDEFFPTQPPEESFEDTQHVGKYTLKPHQDMRPRKKSLNVQRLAKNKHKASKANGNLRHIKKKLRESKIINNNVNDFTTCKNNEEDHNNISVPENNFDSSNDNSDAKLKFDLELIKNSSELPFKSNDNIIVISLKNENGTTKLANSFQNLKKLFQKSDHDVLENIVKTEFNESAIESPLRISKQHPVSVSESNLHQSSTSIDLYQSSTSINLYQSPTSINLYQSFTTSTNGYKNLEKTPHKSSDIAGNYLKKEKVSNKSDSSKPYNSGKKLVGVTKINLPDQTTKNPLANKNYLTRLNKLNLTTPKNKHKDIINNTSHKSNNNLISPLKNVKEPTTKSPKQHDTPNKNKVKLTHKKTEISIELFTEPTVTRENQTTKTNEISPSQIAELLMDKSSARKQPFKLPLQTSNDPLNSSKKNKDGSETNNKDKDNILKPNYGELIHLKLEETVEKLPIGREGPLSSLEDFDSSTEIVKDLNVKIKDLSIEKKYKESEVRAVPRRKDKSAKINSPNKSSKSFRKSIHPKKKINSELDNVNNAENESFKGNKNPKKGFAHNENRRYQLELHKPKRTQLYKKKRSKRSYKNRSKNQDGSEALLDEVKKIMTIADVDNSFVIKTTEPPVETFTFHSVPGSTSLMSESLLTKFFVDNLIPFMMKEGKRYEESATDLIPLNFHKDGPSSIKSKKKEEFTQSKEDMPDRLLSENQKKNEELLLDSLPRIKNSLASNSHTTSSKRKENAGKHKKTIGDFKQTHHPKEAIGNSDKGVNLNNSTNKALYTTQLEHSVKPVVSRSDKPIFIQDLKTISKTVKTSKSHSVPDSEVNFLPGSSDNITFGKRGDTQGTTKHSRSNFVGDLTQTEGISRRMEPFSSKDESDAMVISIKIPEKILLHLAEEAASRKELGPPTKPPGMILNNPYLKDEKTQRVLKALNSVNRKPNLSEESVEDHKNEDNTDIMIADNQPRSISLKETKAFERTPAIQRKSMNKLFPSLQKHKNRRMGKVKDFMKADLIEGDRAMGKEDSRTQLRKMYKKKRQFNKYKKDKKAKKRHTAYKKAKHKQKHSVENQEITQNKTANNLITPNFRKENSSINDGNVVRIIKDNIEENNISLVEMHPNSTEVLTPNETPTNESTTRKRMNVSEHHLEKEINNSKKAKVGRKKKRFIETDWDNKTSIDELYIKGRGKFPLFENSTELVTTEYEDELPLGLLKNIKKVKNGENFPKTEKKRSVSHIRKNPFINHVTLNRKSRFRIRKRSMANDLNKERFANVTNADGLLDVPDKSFANVTKKSTLSKPEMLMRWILSSGGNTEIITENFIANAKDSPLSVSILKNPEHIIVEKSNDESLNDTTNIQIPRNKNSIFAANENDTNKLDHEIEELSQNNHTEVAKYNTEWDKVNEEIFSEIFAKTPFVNEASPFANKNNDLSTSTATHLEFLEDILSESAEESTHYSIMSNITNQSADISRTSTISAKEIPQSTSEMPLISSINLRSASQEATENNTEEREKLHSLIFNLKKFIKKMINKRDGLSDSKKRLMYNVALKKLPLILNRHINQLF